MLFRRFNSETPDEMVLQVDVYTSPDDFSPEQKLYAKRLFVKLIFDLIFTDLCIAAVFLLNDVFFAVPGIYFAFRAISGIMRYGSIMMGDGIRMTLLLFEKVIRIIDINGTKDIPYSHVTDGAFFEPGLMLRFKDGSRFCADITSLSRSGNMGDVLKLLEKKLGKKFKNKFNTPEYREKQAEEMSRNSRRRIDALGTRLAEVSYEPDNTDCRNYCRLILNTGKARTIIVSLIAILGALTLALPVLSLMTRQYVLETVAYLPFVMLLLLLFVSKIGIASPGKKRFTANVGSLISVYLHADGVCAVSDGKELMYKWRELESAEYQPDIGFALDTGDDGVIFIPADMLPEETFEMVEDLVTRGRED